MLGLPEVVLGKPDITFEGDADTTTISTAKGWLKDRLGKVGAGRVVKCPCCSQRVCLRARLISSSQAALLVLLYRTFPVGTVVCINKFVDSLPMEDAKRFFKSREWHRLRHWGLLEQLDGPEEAQAREAFRMMYPDDVEDKIISFHRLTQEGYDYTLGDKMIPKRILIFRNNVVGKDEGEFAGIRDAFKRGPFRMSSLTGDVPKVGKVF